MIKKLAVALLMSGICGMAYAASIVNPDREVLYSRVPLDPKSKEKIKVLAELLVERSGQSNCSEEYIHISATNSGFWVSCVYLYGGHAENERVLLSEAMFQGSKFGVLKAPDGTSLVYGPYMGDAKTIDGLRKNQALVENWEIKEAIKKADDVVYAQKRALEEAQAKRDLPRKLEAERKAIEELKKNLSGGKAAGSRMDGAAKP